MCLPVPSLLTIFIGAMALNQSNLSIGPQERVLNEVRCAGNESSIADCDIHSPTSGTSQCDLFIKCVAERK